MKYMQKVKYDVRNRSSSRKDNEMNLVNQFIDSGIGKTLFIGISVLMLFSVYRSVKQMGQKISLLRQAEQEVQELRLENLELSLKIDDAGSLENLEKEARDRLNYGDEGEIAFVIDEQLMDVGKEKVDEILNPPDSIEDIDVAGQWVEFLIEGY